MDAEAAVVAGKETEAMQMNYNIIWAALMGAVVLYLVLVLAITARMRSRHKEMWERSGNFSLLLNNSIQNSTKFLRYFIFSNSYAELNDRQIAALALAAKGIFALAAILLGGVDKFEPITG
ncbi:MAG: hypothetical protein ABSC92_04715 [Rhizomicrobium sp.]